MKECCENCGNRYKLVKFDYFRGGCKHTDMDGYICMAFASESQAVWMVGLQDQFGLCECYMPKGDE
jgi:hypothetical protein